MAWSTADIPDMTGRRVIVTGANSGIGLRTALELARHGATVVLACRDAGRGAEALAAVQAAVPGAAVGLEPLDLADLESVRAFAGTQAGSGVDVLVNNAGVMALPKRKTADGFEMQFGTNHLGHFALTGLLLPELLSRPAPRVVTLTSMAGWPGRIDFGNLAGERGYHRWIAYSQSKLANLLFAAELGRRVPEITSVAAHPGYAATALQQAGPRMDGSRLRTALYGLTNTLFAQSDEAGALPSLYAATSPDVVGGRVYGPRGLFQSRGRPGRVRPAPQIRDTGTAARLWEVSAELTGVTYEIPAP